MDIEQERVMNREKSIILKSKLYKAIPRENYDFLTELYGCVDYRNYSPVKRLEKAIGIRGIYHRYRFPGDVSPEDYEDMMKPIRVFEMIERGLTPETPQTSAVINGLAQIKPQFLNEIRAMHRELIRLNPELQDIVPLRPNKIRSYVAIISGACSGFPPEDIAAFNHASESPEANQRLNRRKREMSDEIEKISGQKGDSFTNRDGKVCYRGLIENWCPSEKTFQEILRKTKNRYPDKEKHPAPTTDIRGYQSFLENRGYYDD